MLAMILAAGRGVRLAPLTDHIPKPLLPIRGEAVIGHSLRRLAALGVRQVVINAHHLADPLIAAVGDGAAWGVQVLWSREEQLLETGGGVRQALPLLGTDPLLVVNGDILWDIDLAPLLAAFDPVRMDVLLGLAPPPADGTSSKGDFIRLADGRLQRAAGDPAALTFSGLQILRPQALLPFPLEPFSLNRLYDAAQASGRLHGVPLSGGWLDIGTPERLAWAEKYWPVG